LHHNKLRSENRVGLHVFIPERMVSCRLLLVHVRKRLARVPRTSVPNCTQHSLQNMCIYIYIQTYACAHISSRDQRTHIRIHDTAQHAEAPLLRLTIYTQICIQIHIHMYIHAKVSTNIYTCIYIHIYMSVHIHTYT